MAETRITRGKIDRCSFVTECAIERRGGAGKRLTVAAFDSGPTSSQIPALRGSAAESFAALKYSYLRSYGRECRA